MSLEHALYRLGLEHRAMGKALLREHQLGTCGHRTSMDGYCWYCQKRTGRLPSLCRLGHPNWPDEETCAVCGLPTEAQGSSVAAVGASADSTYQRREPDYD